MKFVTDWTGDFLNHSIAAFITDRTVHGHGRLAALRPPACLQTNRKRPARPCLAGLGQPVRRYRRQVGRVAGAWLNRGGAKTFDPWGIAPDIILATLGDLPAFLARENGGHDRTETAPPPSGVRA